MKKKFSIDEIEEMVKANLKKKGVSDVINQDKISEIKNKIKEILDNAKNLKEQENQPTDQAQAKDQLPSQNQTQNQPIQTQNPNITVSSTLDPDKTNIIKKENDLDQREKELIKKELELEEKEKKLQIKEKELSYKPELPSVLKTIQNAEIIVFNENELSFGNENLSNREFRLKNNPDNKKTIKELWLSDAVTKTDVYKVELKKIGVLNFDPYDGTTNFENTNELDQNNKIDSYENQGLDVEMAINSQFPEEPILDSIEPVKDVTQPLMNVYDIDKEKFENNFKDVIAKIVTDQLNKISSETTKQNIFSL